MTYIDKNPTASTVVSIKLTDKGREFLAKGFKDDNIFDVVKFSLGDSEVDYTTYSPGDDSALTALLVTTPQNGNSDLITKLYASGTVPNGTPIANLSTSSIDMTTYQTNINVSVTTAWPPVDGTYNEEYSWTNLGPLQDYDFGISLSTDKRIASFRTYDTVGTTTIKVKGMTSGAYSLLTLNIE